MVDLNENLHLGLKLLDNSGFSTWHNSKTKVYYRVSYDRKSSMLRVERLNGPKYGEIFFSTLRYLAQSYIHFILQDDWRKHAVLLDTSLDANLLDHTYWTGHRRSS